MIELTADFALRLLDEFDGAVAEDRGVLFRVNRRLVRPMKKPDGYYVFQRMEGDRFEVDVSAPLYQDHHVRIERAELDPGNPVVTLRLFRLMSGVFRDCDWVSGVFQAGRIVCIFQERDPPLRLQSEIRQEDGHSVLSLGYMLQRRIGRRFAVGTMGKGSALETFVITGKSDTPGIYITGTAFESTHKQGESVVRAYTSRCGPRGEYNIPVDSRPADGAVKVWYRNEEQKKWECV